MRYLLIDTSNMFFRARHQAHRAADTWTKLGFALHLTLMSANKVARDLGADHVVFALEGRSWRKDHYRPYKANRAVARGQMSESEAEEDKLFWELIFHQNAGWDPQDASPHPATWILGWI